MFSRSCPGRGLPEAAPVAFRATIHFVMFSLCLSCGGTVILVWPFEPMNRGLYEPWVGYVHRQSVRPLICVDCGDGWKARGVPAQGCREDLRCSAAGVLLAGAGCRPLRCAWSPAKRCGLRLVCALPLYRRDRSDAPLHIVGSTLLTEVGGGVILRVRIFRFGSSFRRFFAGV